MTTKSLVMLLRTAACFEEINNRREEIAVLLPEVAMMFEYDQNNSYHPYDLWEHCVRTALEIPKEHPDDMLFLAALLHDIGKPESRCAGRKPEDTESHYYGHPEVSRRIVEENIIPRLELTGEEKKRLIYYVENHDDHVGLRPRNIRRHYETVPLEWFRNLMLLQIGDAVTHDMDRTLIRERYEICKALYEGKAEELYLWLKEEGK